MKSKVIKRFLLADNFMILHPRIVGVDRHDRHDRQKSEFFVLAILFFVKSFKIKSTPPVDGY